MKAFELIRSLIDNVVVTSTEGDLHIDLHGELAGISSLFREGRRGGGLDAETVAQIKVVAAPCNTCCLLFFAKRLIEDR